jgi:hypothetical protein
MCQASDFQTGQVGLAVEHHLAKLAHGALKPRSEVFDGSADIASLGRDRHREVVGLEPSGVTVQIDLVAR